MTFKADDLQPATPVTSETAAKPASHDTAPPPALLDFMLKDWKPASGKPPPRVKYAEGHQQRRRALSKLFPGETLVIPTGHEKVRANDTYYRFRPGTDFYYLTGNHEPDCVLVMEPTDERPPRRALRRAEPGPLGRDLLHRPQQGRALGRPAPRREAERAPLRRARGPRAARARQDPLRPRAAGKVRVLRGMSEKVDAAVPARAAEDKAFAAALSELRLIKDEFEIERARGRRSPRRSAASRT